MAAIVETVAPSSASASCLDFRRVNIESPAEYMSAVIGGIGWLKSSVERTRADDDLTETIRNMRAAQGDIKCAADSLKRFRTTKNVFISKTAEAVARTFDLMAVHEEQSISLVVDLENNIATYGKGTIAQKVGDLEAKGDKIWRLVVAAVAQSTHSLVRYADNKAVGLNITAAERRKLLAELENTFGPAIKDGGQAGQKPLFFAAGMLHGFLSDAKWKSFDE